MELSHVIQRTGNGPSASDNARNGRSFPDYLQKVKPEIDRRIVGHITSGCAGDALDKRLEGPLRQGKRMRAGLLMLIYDSYGDRESNREMALDLAAAVEIAHAASLIVDDMLDEDDTRHGMKAPHITMGHKSAILGTVALLSYPYQIASRYGHECVDGMARTHRAMVRAASREMTGVPSLGVGQAYESIIENKTGVLFGLAARYGGTAAGCPSAEVELLSEYGLLTGKTMQIADDITDLAQLMNGRSTRISGSEAILLRCCLGNNGDELDQLDVEAHALTGPLGSARRKDIEGIVDRRLRTSVEEASEVARRLNHKEDSACHRVRPEGDLPDLSKVPEEIAGMMFRGT